jgi:uncharacterized protein (TIGR01244 family)
MSMRSLFFSSLLASTVLFLGYFYLTNQVWKVLDLRVVGKDIYVNGQIGVEEIRTLSRQGIRTIIDMRPDGEDAAQTPSAVIGRSAHDQGMSFLYVPVVHGEIPSDEVVTRLTETLRSAEKPVLLYCRTGNRAMRTYALVLASNPGGPDQAEILALAHRAGHGVEDLRGAIQQRIAARPATRGGAP